MPGFFTLFTYQNGGKSAHRMLGYFFLFPTLCLPWLTEQTYTMPSLGAYGQVSERNACNSSAKLLAHIIIQFPLLVVIAGREQNIPTGLAILRLLGGSSVKCRKRSLQMAVQLVKFISIAGQERGFR